MNCLFQFTARNRDMNIRIWQKSGGRVPFDAVLRESALGSTRSSETFSQVTDSRRRADVPSEILNVPTMNGCFAR